MAVFEVFMPQSDAAGNDVTIRLQSDNWLNALQAGLSTYGKSGVSVQNLLIDIQQDGSINVSDSKSGRVFRIRELQGEVLKAAAVPAQHAPAHPAPSKESILRVAAMQMPDTPMEVMRAPHVQAPSMARQAPVRDIDVDAALADLFEATNEIASGSPQKAVLEGFMNLAEKYVHCEAASIILSDINRLDMYFETASGPAKNELLKLRVPYGMGIVGFSVMHGVSLAISDVNRDPRFYAEISKKLNFKTRSILCVPLKNQERVYGALELINKKANDSFTPGEMNVVEYIAHRAAEYLQQEFDRVGLSQADLDA
ncbi:MAG: hypothetical protein GMKNLPBB_02542 [Myxococcota bacterium]|nr:hypothetical protein [Myxococcota bacterium]